MRFRIFRLFLTVAPALCGLGCADDRTLPISSWELTPPDSAQPIHIELPAHVDDRLPKQSCRYSLAAEVMLPPAWQGKALTFAVPHLRAHSELRINGQQMVLLNASAAEAEQGSMHPRWRIPAELTKSPELRLELGIEHSWTQSGWLDSIPRISPAPLGDQRYLFSSLFNEVSALVALGAAAFVTFVYALIFVLDRRRTAHGWFALQALSATFYPAFELGLLKQIFGAYDAHLTVMLVTLATTAGIHFLHVQFKLGKPKIFSDLGFVVAALAVIVFSNPFTMSRYAGPVAVLVIVGHVVYTLILLGRASRDHGQRALLLLLAWVALWLTAVPDFGAWLGFGELYGGMRTACVGITLIALAQSAELSVDHLRSLRRADELNSELAARLQLIEAKHREVEVLNEELRFQVQSRSEQLSVALSKVGMPHGQIRPLEAGEVIETRYKVVRKVGEGAMGAVYEVERVSDGKHFALKMLTDVSGGLNVARFAREAQIISQLNHPNVVSIVDVDVASSGFFYMIMEFVNGLSLRQQRKRYRDIQWALPVLTQVADGLRAIHAKGVVHRDLKPGNILVTDVADGSAPIVKIADFGISSLESAAEEISITASESPAAKSQRLGPQSHRHHSASSMRAAFASNPFDTGPKSLTPASGHSMPAQQGIRFGSNPYLPAVPLPAPTPSPAASASNASPQQASASLPQRVPSSPALQALPDDLPASLRQPPQPQNSIQDLIAPPSQRSLAEKLMDRLEDSWDIPPASGRAAPISLRSGPMSLRGPSSRKNSLHDGDPLTQTGALMGTPIYMAPELAAGVKFAKPSADVFSFGVIAFEVLTGKAPFPEPPALMQLAGRVPPPPPPLRSMCTEIAPSIAAILDRCLSRIPGDRPSSAELSDTLRQTSGFDAKSP